MKRTTALTVASLIFTGLAFFSGRGQTWAQEHGHEAPHGGEVRTMGDHHVEFLVIDGENNKGHIVVYLLNADLNPVAVDKNKIEGVVYLTLPDKSKRTLKLTVSTEEHGTPHTGEAGHGEEGEHEMAEKHEAGKEESHAEEGEHAKEKMHAGDKAGVAHLVAEVNLKGVDAFDAVVSLKMDKKRKNLRFKYARGEHGHEEGEEHKEDGHGDKDGRH
jgi:hypothetical protein